MTLESSNSSGFIMVSGIYMIVILQNREHYVSLVVQ